MRSKQNISIWFSIFLIPFEDSALRFDSSRVDDDGHVQPKGYTTDKVRRSTFLIFILALLAFVLFWIRQKCRFYLCICLLLLCMKYERRMCVLLHCIWRRALLNGARVCSRCGPGETPAHKKVTWKSLVQWTEQMEKVQTHLLFQRVFHLFMANNKKNSRTDMYWSSARSGVRYLLCGNTCTNRHSFVLTESKGSRRANSAVRCALCL